MNAAGAANPSKGGKRINHGDVESTEKGREEKENKRRVDRFNHKGHKGVKFNRTEKIKMN
jgi:hypothetical protein